VSASTSNTAAHHAGTLVDDGAGLPTLGSEQDECETRTALEALTLMLLMCKDATALADMRRARASEHVAVFLRDRRAELRMLACEVLGIVAGRADGDDLVPNTRENLFARATKYSRSDSDGVAEADGVAESLTAMLWDAESGVRDAAGRALHTVVYALASVGREDARRGAGEKDRFLDDLQDDLVLLSVAARLRKGLCSKNLDVRRACVGAAGMVGRIPRGCPQIVK
jgi:hypothetical protein